MARKYSDKEGQKESGFGDQPRKMAIPLPEASYFRKGDWDGSMRYAEEKARIDEKDAEKLRKHSYGYREYVS